MNYGIVNTHIDNVTAGDTIEHHGKMVTVCKKDIKRGRKIIDTVFYNDTPVQSANDIQTALLARGEMPDDCTVTKVRRVLKDEYELQANYGYGHGWEIECTEETRKEANARLKEYRENAGTIGSYRVIHRRIPV